MPVCARSRILLSTFLSLSLAVAASGCKKSSGLKVCGVGGECPDGQACADNHCYPMLCESDACHSGEVCVDGVCLTEECISVTCPAGELCAADGKCHASKCGQTDCAGGRVCEGTACVDPACYGRTCPSGQVCVAGGCVQPDCPTKACADTEVCVSNSCVDVQCAGAECPEGKVCQGGQCVTCKPGDTTCSCGSGPACADDQACVNGTCTYAVCREDGCRKGEICQANVCVSVPCAGKTCSEGQVCVAGACESASCGEQTCAVGEACRNGACVDGLCAGVSCPSGEVCTAGRCLPTACDGTPCPTGMVCSAGRCVEAACVDVTCQPGRSCVAGACEICLDGNLTCGCAAATCNFGEVCMGGACREEICMGEACKVGEYCVNGACVTPDCAGKRCKSTEVCMQGRCVTEVCGETSCEGGEVCQDGRCVDPSCAGVSCSSSQVCVDGACLDRNCPGTQCPEGKACYEGYCTDVGCIGARCPAGAFCREGVCEACQPSETECADGADEDCDGLIDCADTQCKGKSCDDFSACTTGDTCSAAGLCAGAPKLCDLPADSCQLPGGACDPATGDCKYAARSAGASCFGTVTECAQNRCSDKGVCTSSPLPDDTACGAQRACLSGACQDASLRRCIVGGQVWYAGDVDPSSRCQVCMPAKNPNGWTVAPDGFECDAGKVCGSGDCKAGCSIAGAFYAPGAQHPSNACRVCDPAQNVTDWTVKGVAAGETCGIGKVCSSGACVSGCLIDGVAYAAKALNPANPCQVCNAAKPTEWSNAAEGASCGQGRVCAAKSCKPGCRVNGAFYAPDASSPDNECLKCKPALSTTHFVVDDGGTCSLGACVAGRCKAGCTIGGTFFADKDVNPENVCQLCDAAKSTTDWTPAATGKNCGGVMTCTAAGECGNGCAIGGKTWKTGQRNPENPCQFCNPPKSTTDWSTVKLGTWCGVLSQCLNDRCTLGCFIGGQFYPSEATNPDKPCRKCDPKRAWWKWSWCAKKTVCWEGACKAGCIIDQKFYKADETHPNTTCGYCNIDEDNYHWWWRPQGYDCASRKACDPAHQCKLGCGVGNRYWKPGQVNPWDSCQYCDNEKDNQAWQSQPNATVCPQYGSLELGVCNGGHCSDGCWIGGGYREADTTNAGNPCSRCNPTLSPSSVQSWSTNPLAPCASGRVCSIKSQMCCPAGSFDC